MFFNFLEIFTSPDSHGPPFGKPALTSSLGVCLRQRQNSLESCRYGPANSLEHPRKTPRLAENVVRLTAQRPRDTVPLGEKRCLIFPSLV